MPHLHSCFPEVETGNSNSGKQQCEPVENSVNRITFFQQVSRKNRGNFLVLINQTEDIYFKDKSEKKVFSFEISFSLN